MESEEYLTELFSCPRLHVSAYFRDEYYCLENRGLVAIEARENLAYRVIVARKQNINIFGS